MGGALRRRQDAARDLPPELRKRVLKRIEKEQAKSRGEELFPKLAEQRGDIHVIKDQLPTIFYHVEFPPAEVQQIVRDLLSAYVATLPSAYQASAGRRISSCGGRV